MAASRLLTQNYCPDEVVVMWMGRNFGVFAVGGGGRGGPAWDELVRPRGGASCLEEVLLLIN